uniref:Uncharacterized protein n=1 Tax=Glossina austeni TaxID=7395 RepID=A0A1A9UUH4_GLOAU
MLTQREGKYPHFIEYVKNFLILLLAVLGFAVGSFESLYGIITHFEEEEEEEEEEENHNKSLIY